MMYTITKGAGSRSTISVTDNETGRVTIIGQISPTIIAILTEHEGITFGKDGLEYSTSWLIDVKGETGKLLLKTTMPSSKPPRKPKDTPTEPTIEPTPELPKKKVNLMDILLADDE